MRGPVGPTETWSPPRGANGPSGPASPLLTVVVVTNRVGGMDVLFAGLREQSFQDFEVIVVDELLAYTGVVARDYDLHVGKLVTPIPPGAGPRWGNYMRSLNMALRNASGSRLVFWSDYTCPHPGSLAVHARFHAAHCNDVMLGGIEYTELPELHPDFPRRYGWLAMGHDVANHREETYRPWLDDRRRHELYEEWRVNYERDLERGALRPFMHSTFAKPVESFDDVRNLRVFNHDRRDTSPFLNLKNDSIPRHLLASIGGFDERADGCHGHQDSITARQLAKVGAKFVSVPENPVKLLDPHGIAIIRRMERPDTSNLKIYEEAG